MSRTSNLSLFLLELFWIKWKAFSAYPCKHSDSFRLEKCTLWVIDQVHCSKVAGNLFLDLILVLFCFFHQSLHSGEFVLGFFCSTTTIVLFLYFLELHQSKHETDHLHCHEFFLVLFNFGICTPEEEMQSGHHYGCFPTKQAQTNRINSLCIIPIRLDSLDFCEELIIKRIV